VQELLRVGKKPERTARFSLMTGGRGEVLVQRGEWLFAPRGWGSLKTTLESAGKGGEMRESNRNETLAWNGGKKRTSESPSGYILGNRPGRRLLRGGQIKKVFSGKKKEGGGLWRERKPFEGQASLGEKRNRNGKGD